MCLKFKENIINPLASTNLIDDNSRVVLELVLFASNVKMEACGVLEAFFFCLNRIPKKC
jgi:hypothetical protein